MTSFEAKKRLAVERWNALHEGREPVVYIGTASCGRAAGALAVLDEVRKTLVEHDLRARIVQVGCVGPCYLEPLLDIEMPGRPRVSYANVTTTRARHLIEKSLMEDDLRLKLAVG